MDIDHRIGFAERDEAARRLSEHHAAGRLDLEEFNERMDAAMQARTIGDLIDLFADLPDEDWMIQANAGTGGELSVTPAAGAVTTRTLPGKASTLQWGIIIGGAVLLGAMMSGQSWLIWVALGLLVIGWAAEPDRASRQSQTISYVDGDLESEVRALIGAGHKVKAIKLWRERTGADLLTAKNAVEAIERQNLPELNP